MTLSLTGTPEELKHIVEALALTIPALAPLRAIAIQSGHADVTVSLPTVGNITAQVTLVVEAGGT